jgi:hypothetical protein
MNQLYEGRIDEYLRDAALGDGPCIFVHVPKTAGTSLRTEIAAILQPDVNIEVDYTDTSRDFNLRMDDAVTAFIAQAESSLVRFASGHILGRHVTRIRSHFPQARFITFLRNPVDRLVSDYRHQRSPRHPVYREFIARVPSIEAYLELQSEREKMAKHLVSPDIRLLNDPQECIDFILRTYAFVGIQEMYPISFRLLTALLGQPGWPKVRENVAADSEAERQVDPALAARIRALNPLDCAIYGFFQSRLAAVRDRLAQRLA